MLTTFIKKELYILKNKLKTSWFFTILVFFLFIFSFIYGVSFFGFSKIIAIDKITINMIIRIISLGILFITPVILISSLFTGIYTAFDAKENETIFYTPINMFSYYTYLVIKITIHSSLFPSLMFLASILALSKLQKYNILISIIFFISLLIYFFILNSLSLLILCLIFKLFKSSYIKEWLISTLIIISTLLIFLLRISSPESLVKYDTRINFYKFVESFSIPLSPYFPGSYLTQILNSLIKKDFNLFTENILYLILLFIITIAINKLISKYLFFDSYKNYKSIIRQSLDHFSKKLYSKNVYYTIIKKEWYSLLNNRIQFLQIVMLSILAIIYFFNLYSIKNGVKYVIQYIFIIYFNIFFSVMICAALSVRFIYPSISTESYGIYKILSIISEKKLLTAKALFYGIPLMCLTLFLNLGGLIIFNASLKVVAFSIINTVFLSVLSMFLASLYSVKYKNIHITSPDQMIFSYGAIKLMTIIFIISSIILIIELPLILKILGYKEIYHLFYKPI